MTTEPEPSQYSMLRVFDRYMPDIYDIKAADQGPAAWLRLAAKQVVAGAELPNPMPKFDKKFDQAVAMLDRDRLANVVRAERRGRDLYLSLIDADADAIIDSLGFRHLEGWGWEALRADLAVAVAIKQEGPERSRAWGALANGLRELDEAMRDSARAAQLSESGKFLALTKRRLLDLYMRCECPPHERWTF